MHRRTETAAARIGRIRLERPSLAREAEFLRGVIRSRALHRAFVEPPCTSSEYHAYLRRQRRPSQESFFVIDAESGRLAGVVNVNDIVRDSIQSASLGYYAFVPFAGNGLMREALRVVVGWCFRDLGLHRLEANIQPGNIRSVALVEGLGFRLEGLSPRYLKIRGRWRDHERWALLAEEWRRYASRAASGAGALSRVRPAARVRHDQPSTTASTPSVSAIKAPAAV
ncbi:MAG TPA: GNAT family protein [Gammaproteobacteria bacterium]